MQVIDYSYNRQYIIIIAQNAVGALSLLTSSPIMSLERKVTPVRKWILRNIIPGIVERRAKRPSDKGDPIPVDVEQA
jgi:hypothetical protein